VITDDIHSGIVAHVRGLQIVDIETVRWLKGCLLSPRHTARQHSANTVPADSQCIRWGKYSMRRFLQYEMH